MPMSSPHLAGIVVQIGVYGSNQRPEMFSPEHVSSSIAVSTQYGSGVYLLNPSVTSDDGNDMEAWLLDSRFCPEPCVFQASQNCSLINWRCRSRWYRASSMTRVKGSTYVRCS